ncbi:hydroxyisourate hydrolase [Granulicella arctica]|uniref:5-hydroxyisourate hydrolase n=1 Tax=Granulicella arctica TaxID=940613 RepID=A0A7Y9PHV5_9BACT|nr:hydroxyisourate hydrolase [Granulicella arctica]NYF79413.1 5-hydroxyisourate hydrolase [Granulicella arctica]
MGISTHILDTAKGRPAAHIGVTLEREDGGRWTTLHAASTDEDGRCKQLLPDGQELTAGTYRVRFATADYYTAQELQGLYPLVEITFTVTSPEQHYHIPLLLTANGYTTYRGS